MREVDSVDSAGSMHPTDTQGCIQGPDDGSLHAAMEPVIPKPTRSVAIQGIKHHEPQTSCDKTYEAITTNTIIIIIILIITIIIIIIDMGRLSLYKAIPAHN